MQDYASFLLRRWHLQDGTYRIAIEHVQSGERRVVATLDAALVWITTRPDESEDDATGAIARGGRAPTVGDRAPP